MSAHTVEKNFGEALCGLVLRELDEVRLMEIQANSVIIDSAEKCLDGNVSIPATEGALALSFRNVAAQESEQRTQLALAVLLGEFVTFERGIESQAKKVRVSPVVFEDSKGDVAEESFVVAAFSQRGDIFEPLGYARLPRLHVEYGGIQLLLGCKVPENSNFVDPGGKRNLFCGGAPESLLGEKSDCGFENLLADYAAGAIFGSGDDIARSVYSSADPSCHYILSSTDGKHVPACIARTYSSPAGLVNWISRPSMRSLPACLRPGSMLFYC